MNKVILLRFGEIFLKGRNKGVFVNLLLRNIKNALKGYKFELHDIQGRFLLSGYDENLEEQILAKVGKVFGLISYSKAVEINTSKNDILSYLRTINLKGKSFKVEVKRADKSFEHNSIEFGAICGHEVLEANANCKVDIKNPEITIFVDIRQNKKTYVYYSSENLLGGLPVGCGGKCLVLLSGGIDSPVASFLMAKRGMNVSFLHFHSYPYTSIQAREKVFKLAKISSEYTGKGKMFVANIKKLQEEINANCCNDYMIAIMRRVMMAVAQNICKKYGYQAIVTGENLGQVASQTIESLTLTNLNAGEIPVLRPLICFDKTEIIEISKKIGTYSTSIEPYEDCCTVFLPKNPVIKPKLENLLKEEAKLDINGLVQEILNSLEIID